MTPATEVLVPVMISIGSFAMIFGIYYLKSRENMALIERGINPRQNMLQPKPFVNLKYGLLLLGSGIGVFVAYFISLTQHDDNPALYFALVAIGGGLGLVISYMIEKREWLDKKRDE
jgi:hypothetical protein